jgi:hypothetical protein
VCLSQVVGVRVVEVRVLPLRQAWRGLLVLLRLFRRWPFPVCRWSIVEVWGPQGVRRRVLLVRPLRRLRWCMAGRVVEVQLRQILLVGLLAGLSGCRHLPEEW